MEKFIISPHHQIYVLPKSVVSFELALLKPDQHLLSLEKIVLPNDNFKWSSNQDNLGKVKNDDGILNVFGFEGSFNVKAEDKSKLLMNI